MRGAPAKIMGSWVLFSKVGFTAIHILYQMDPTSMIT